MKANALYFVLCKPYQMFELSKGDFVISCSSTSNHIGYVCKYVPSFVQMTRRQMREIGERNRFCSPTSSFYFDPPGTDHFSLGLFEKLLFFYNHKNKETAPRHSRICVTCKLEKQSVRGASCTGNCLY